MTLRPAEQRLLDLVLDFATSTEVAAEDAPTTVWRVARYGGTAGSYAVLGRAAELDQILTAAQAAGAWVYWEGAAAASVPLVAWRQAVPDFTLVYMVSETRDRFSGHPDGRTTTAGPVHVRSGDGIALSPMTLCGQGMAALETNPGYRTVPLPNRTRGDICVDCQARMAAATATSVGNL